MHKTKQIHILLSKESFEELEDLKESLKLPIFLKERRLTYEEYLQKEKENPTMALFG